jgi:rare lipoprotein A
MKAIKLYIILIIFLCLLIYAYLSIDLRLEKAGLPLSLYPKEGIASWYSSEITATGEKLNDLIPTMAMRHREFDKYYRVYNLETGKYVVVRHNNWGPKRTLFQRGRIVDLNKCAFSELADPEEGLIKVRVEEIQP